MNKAHLLSGRGTGAPLYLAWMLGLIVFVGILHILEIVGALVQNELIVWWMIHICCIIPFAAWQAALLVATKGRRLCWMLASFPAALLLLLEIPGWDDVLMGAALLQTISLVGTRRRVWAWLLAALMGFSLHPMTVEASYALYEKFSTFLQIFIPGVFVIEFYLVRDVVEMSMLGAIAAFLMPPKQESKQ